MIQQRFIQQLQMALLGLIAILVLGACVPMEHGMSQHGGDAHEDSHGDSHDRDHAISHDDKMMYPATIPVGGAAFFPESVAVHNGMAYVSAFFTGEIQQIDMMSGEATTLVEAGDNGVVMSWGLWYDDANDLLLACANRNQMGLQENNNAARAIDPTSGETSQRGNCPRVRYVIRSSQMGMATFT